MIDVSSCYVKIIWNHSAYETAEYLCYSHEKGNDSIMIPFLQALSGLTPYELLEFLLYFGFEQVDDCFDEHAYQYFINLTQGFGMANIPITCREFSMSGSDKKLSKKEEVESSI